MEKNRIKSSEYLYPISVLMPVYNAAKYIREAIDSIIRQTFSDFEFIIIDDGSIDETVNIIKEYKDDRIKLIFNEKNMGLIYTLNKGINLSQGKYIARMDADDICINTRLEKQINYLEKNVQVSFLGTAFIYLGTNYEIHFPTDNERIKIKLLENTAFIHPGMMMRKQTFIDYKIFYDENYKHAEDYHLWTVAARLGILMANLDEILIYYRQHEEQVSTLRLKEQEDVAARIRLEYLSYYFKDYISEKELLQVNILHDISFLDKLKIFDKLIKINNKYQIFNSYMFKIHMYKLIYKSIDVDCNLKFVDFFKIINLNITGGVLFTVLKMYTKNLIKIK